MKRLFSILALALALVLPWGPVQARPLEFKDHLALTWISQVVVSPDGKTLALVVARRSLEKNHGQSSLLLVSASSGAPAAPAGFDGEGCSQPAFSPDGRTLAFVTKAGDKPVFRLLDLTNGKSRDLPLPGGGASGLRFSAKGRSLIFEGRVYPGCKDAECNDARRVQEEASPVLARAFTKLLYRHWDAFDDGLLAHVLELPLDGGPLDDLTPSDDLDITHGWDLSPDGQALALGLEPGRERAWRLNPEIYIMDAGKPKTLRRLTDNPALDASPAFSPDGRMLAWVTGTRAQYESDQFRVVVRRLKDDQTLLPPTDSEEPVEAWGWRGDSQGLWLTFPKLGRNSLAEAGLEGGLKVLAEGRTMTQVAEVRGGQYVYVKDSLRAGPELYAFGGGAEKRLTDLNTKVLEGVDLARVEDYWWVGAGGRKIHGFLLVPTGLPKGPAPFLMVIHGGPQGANTDSLHPRWNGQLLAAPGYLTLLPNPRGSTGYGRALKEEVSRDWGGAAYEDLMAGLHALVKEGRVDPTRACAMGGSFGGYMTNWMEAKTTEWRCLISHAGVYDLPSMYGSTEELWFPEWEYGGPPWEGSRDYQRFSPSSFVKNFKTPMLVIHGARDYRVPENQAMQLFTALQRRGVESRFLYFPDETHFVVKPRNSELWYREVHQWLERWLKR
jgi:dipeptidyl aminopeptidase/acylaminoacyl peptidase